VSTSLTLVANEDEVVVGGLAASFAVESAHLGAVDGTEPISLWNLLQNRIRAVEVVGSEARVAVYEV